MSAKLIDPYRGVEPGPVPEWEQAMFRARTVAEVQAALAARTAAFDESQHPRDEKGQFTDAGGEGRVSGPSESPLTYNHSYPVQRFSIVDPNAPVETRNRYFKPEGYTDKERYDRHVDGPPEHTVAFLDFHREDESNLKIDFVMVRDDQRGGFRGAGYTGELLRTLYEKNPNDTINWGRMMEPVIEGFYRKFKAEFPDQTGSGHFNPL